MIWWFIVIVVTSCVAELSEQLHEITSHDAVLLAVGYCLTDKWEEEEEQKKSRRRIMSQVIKKFTATYGTLGFIASFIVAHQWIWPSRNGLM
jgi:3-deoxy-D-arabino-heptulosonate 7-phosphate (DAHP) synthase class II